MLQKEGSAKENNKRENIDRWMRNEEERSL
jgi:hypothetical protein